MYISSSFSSSGLLEQQAAPKCIYEHRERQPDGPSFGRFLPILPVGGGNCLTFWMILIILLLFIFTILLFLFYFGSKSSGKTEDVSSAEEKSENSLLKRSEVERHEAGEEAKAEKLILRFDDVANGNLTGAELSKEVHQVPSHSERRESKSEDFDAINRTPGHSEDVENTPEALPPLENTPKASNSSTTPEICNQTPSPEGSPKSTSSCISSSILTDPYRTSRPTSLSGSSPVLSVASSPPFFNFERKTPEFKPRMMTEEFEELDRSIEQRKKDIRDLLKRIESTKRQHRRFSEHLQRVQYDHLLD